MPPARDNFRPSAGAAVDAGPAREEIDHATVPPRRARGRPAGPGGARQPRRAPASAGVQFNALVENALTDNALATTGSPLAELDGVRVEAVLLPDVAQ